MDQRDQLLLQYERYCRRLLLELNALLNIQSDDRMPIHLSQYMINSARKTVEEVGKNLDIMVEEGKSQMIQPKNKN
jgi:hypothetical protein